MDLLDLTFADFVELHGTFRNCLDFPIAWIVILINDNFLQSRKENNTRQLVKLVDFMEYSRYFQEIYPSQGTQAMLTQRQRKFELFNPSQAKPH